MIGKAKAAGEDIAALLLAEIEDLGESSTKQAEATLRRRTR